MVNHIARSPYLISRGEFAKAAAQYLGDLQANVLKQVRDIDEIIRQPERVECILAVLWRPDDELCDSLNEISYAYKVPFLPLVADAKHLIVGPLVIPDGGSCWSCWAKRSKQHDPWWQQRALVMKYYSANPGEGPKGYLESVALLGAGWLSEILVSLRTGSVSGGTIWKIDPIRLDVSTGRVVGVHGCRFCGLNRPPKTRTFVDIHTSLQGLWKR